MPGSKNGSVTRKRFGYGYILGRYLRRLDQSYCEILLLLLNHQSSSHLLLWEGAATGTRPAANRQAEISTPYGWLSSLTEVEPFLSPSVNLVELYREVHVQADHEVAQVRREMHDQLFAALQVVPKGCLRSGIHPDEKDFACRSTTVLRYPMLAAGLATCSETSSLPRWLRHSTEQFAEPRGDMGRVRSPVRVVAGFVRIESHSWFQSVGLLVTKLGAVGDACG